MEDKDSEIKKMFGAWLKKILIRTRIDYIRKLNKRNEVSLDELNIETYSAFDITNIEDRDFSFENDSLESAFYSIPESCRKILKMIFFDGKTPEEIAQECNCSLKYVYNRKSVGISKLKQMLRGDL